MKLNILNTMYSELLNTTITVNGWVMTCRTQKDITFIKINDGSNAKGIQLIVDSSCNELDKVTTGCSITATGLLVKSPAPEQPYEMQVHDLIILGCSSPDEYPLAKGKLPMDYLRKYVHLRARTSSFGSIFRIKSAISHAMHEFFRDQGYHHINPNIITVNECEGGAGVFQITEHDISNHNMLPKVKDISGNVTSNVTNNHDWKQDHFDRPAFLTVSSQLQLEALACSLGSVYTTNKSFRSEHSTTNKHLSEFEHLEIETTFITLEELMQIGEDYIKYVGRYLLENALEDIDNLGKFVSKGLKERIKCITEVQFIRLKYSDAIDILKKASGLSKPVEYGEDLCSEYENYLTTFFNAPVFVYNWPLAIKSFYMKPSSKPSSKPSLNDDTCENFDLLMPYKVGELIGGSMRNDNYESILEIMKTKGVTPDPLQFYLDLRKFGSVPHGGFGLGLDRMCMMFTGMDNIKDVVAFPVHFKNCNY